VHTVTTHVSLYTPHTAVYHHVIWVLRFCGSRCPHWLTFTFSSPTPPTCLHGWVAHFAGCFGFTVTRLPRLYGSRGSSHAGYTVTYHARSHGTYRVYAILLPARLHRTRFLYLVGLLRGWTHRAWFCTGYAHVYRCICVTLGSHTLPHVPTVYTRLAHHTHCAVTTLRHHTAFGFTLPHHTLVLRITVVHLYFSLHAPLYGIHTYVPTPFTRFPHAVWFYVPTHHTFAVHHPTRTTLRLVYLWFGTVTQFMYRCTRLPRIRFTHARIALRLRWFMCSCIPAVTHTPHSAFTACVCHVATVHILHAFMVTLRTRPALHIPAVPGWFFIHTRFHVPALRL